MFAPWIKRKSLKHSLKTKSMVVEGNNPSLIMLLTLAGLMVVVGVFAVRHSHAATPVSEGVVPVVSVSSSPTPTSSPEAIR
jgi:hypothetical protein